MLRFKFSFLVCLTFLIFFQNKTYSVGSCTFSNPPGPGNLCSSCDGGIGGIGQSCGIPNYTENEPNVGGCNACVGIEAGTGYYLYAYHGSDATIGVSSCASYTWGGGDGIGYPNPQDSNVSGCWWGASLPSACNHGYSTEYCGSGGGGGGGQCEGESSGGSCPVAYRNRNCSDVPCSFRIDCNCQCDCDSNCEVGGSGQCQDSSGGGPTATPTPTPTPHCTLSCPGGGSGGSGGTGSGGSGVGGSGGSGSGPTIVPPYASGNISYAGYNGFSCSTFDNGSSGVGACPSSGGSGSGGLGSGGGSEAWTEAATYNMLCGEQPHTYTAEVVGGSSGGGVGASPTATPAPGTPTPTPTPGLYPQGCSIGGTVTPTPPGHGSGAGLGSGGSSSLSCSCSVTLGCQTTRETPPSDPTQESGSCNPGVCDFTVNPEVEVFNTELTFTVDHASSLDQNTFNFSDNSGSHDIGDATSTTHTFVNAGVYPVTLTCSNGPTSIDCTRNVNAYCNNGVVPTATPTPAPASSWFKLKNTAFSREGSVTNTIPSTATSFDNDDDGICEIGQPSVRACMVSGVAGSTLTEGALSLGDGTSSSTGWQKTNTVLVKRFTPTSFRDYALARKRTNTIADIADIQTGVINKFSGNLTVSNADFSGFSEDFVLLVDGDLTVTDSLTNTANISAALIVTGTLKIESAVDELNGIFVTTNVNLSSDTTPSTTPLKIIGNLVSINPGDTTQRARGDTDKPSLFVSGDSTKYTSLIGLLGINTYDQEEITQ